MKRFFKLRRKILYSVALSIPLIGTAIVVHNLEKVPYTDRLRLMLLKEEKEIEFGELIQKEINKRFKPLPSGDPRSLMVNQIGQRILSVCGKQRNSYNWEFKVIQSPFVNSFATHGGKIYILSGYLDVLKTQDEVAAMLSHEIAHVLTRHPSEKQSYLDFFTVFSFLKFFGIDKFWMLKVSREIEREADEIGLLLMSRACFKPSAALTNLKVIRNFEFRGFKIPELLSTHPPTNERIQRLERLIEIGHDQRKKFCLSKTPKLENWYSDFPKK